MFAALGQMLAHLPDTNSGDAPGLNIAMQHVYRYAILLMLIGLFLRAVMMLGITRQALGLNTGSPFVFFAIGKEVWRLFGAYFIFQILMQIGIFVVVFVVAIPAVIVGLIAAAIVNASHLSPEAIQTLIALGIVALALIFYGGIIYVVIRLGFLLTPVVVVEKSLAIERVWSLSKGNVWRLFLVGLSVMLPIMIVYMAVMVAVFWHAWPALASMPHEGHVPAAVVSQHLMAFFQALFSQWIVFVPIGAIFATLVYGLLGGASAFAYRALVPPPKPGAAAPQVA